MPKRMPSPGIVGVGLSAFLIASAIGMGAVQQTGEAVPIDNDDLGDPASVKRNLQCSPDAPCC